MKNNYTQKMKLQKKLDWEISMKSIRSTVTTQLAVQS